MEGDGGEGENNLINFGKPLGFAAIERRHGEEEKIINVRDQKNLHIKKEKGGQRMENVSETIPSCKKIMFPSRVQSYWGTTALSEWPIS